MPKYPNQKHLTIHKHRVGLDDRYTVITLEAIDELFKSGLSDRGIRLWLYFASNQDGYEEDMSPAKIQRDCGISDSTFRRAKEDLIQARYLIETDDRTLEFYDKPQMKWDF